MAIDNMFPSLSEDGWVTSSKKVAEYLFSHFFVANYSQSHNYFGHVKSFPFILGEYSGDVPAIISETRRSLGSYFGKYFTSVEIEVYELPQAVESASVTISIYVAFTDADGVKTTLEEALRTDGNVFERVKTISNG